VPIIIMHVLYFVLWFLGMSPVVLFFILYIVMLVYYIAHAGMQRFINRKVERQLPGEYITRVFCMQSIHSFECLLDAVTQNACNVGRRFRGNIIFNDQFNKSDRIDEELFEPLKKDLNLKAITFISSLSRYEVKELSKELAET